MSRTIPLTKASNTFIEFVDSTKPFLQNATPEQVKQLKSSVKIDSQYVWPEVSIEKFNIPDKDDGHDIKCDVFRPKNSPKDELLPVFINIHGGGWSDPATEYHSYLSAQISEQANCVVISPNYQLSPAARFPIALQECYNVLYWVSDPDNSKALHTDPTRVAIGGDSAGGNMSIGCLLFAKVKKLKNDVKYQALFYPAVTNSQDSESYRLFGDDYFLTRDGAEQCFKAYCEEGMAKNPLVSPLYASMEQLATLPPTLLITAGADILRDGGEAFGAKLLQAGVPVTSVRVQGVLHGFMTFGEPQGAEVISIIDMACAGLRRAFCK